MNNLSLPESFRGHLDFLLGCVGGRRMAVGSAFQVQVVNGGDNLNVSYYRVGTKKPVARAVIPVINGVAGQQRARFVSQALANIRQTISGAPAELAHVLAGKTRTSKQRRGFRNASRRIAVTAA